MSSRFDRKYSRQNPDLDSLKTLHRRLLQHQKSKKFAQKSNSLPSSGTRFINMDEEDI